MWDTTKQTIRRLLPRKTLHVLAGLLVVGSLATAVFMSPSAMAIDASWKQGTLEYNGHTYTPVGTAAANDPRKFTEGSKLYAYIEKANTPDQKVHYLVFPAGSDTKTATNAKLISFKNSPPSTYTDPSTPQDVTVKTTDNPSDQPQTTEANSAANVTSDTGKTSCDSSLTFGIGWVLCPVVNVLASGMDWMFEQLASFLVVRPAPSDSNSALYRSWEIMRNLANIAFVIAFLIVIYSQITSLGYSNYNIKRTLPRIIVAAILVNISYWICALAIDISNSLGYGVHDLFISVRDSISTGGGNWNNADVVNWKSVAGVILAGGAAAFGGYSFVATAGSLFFLVPILVGASVAVLVALIIMAARQAIITIFVIIAPLAFVAYILPNTEKYFDKWKDIFLTMLLMFPIFAIIFGGSQVAGMAIIQNADSLNIVILGMAVQVAPVILTPLLIKFSGSLLGRIANIVNDPKRGIMDRTRNWSRDKTDERKARVLAGYGSNKNPLNTGARKVDRGRRKRAAYKSFHEARAGELFESSKTGRDLAMRNKDLEEDKKLTHAEVDKAFNNYTRTNAAAMQRDLSTRVTSDESNASKLRMDTAYEEAKAGVNNYGVNSQRMDEAVLRAQNTASEVALTSMRKGMAERKHAQERAQDLVDNTKTIDNELLRDYASGLMGQSGNLSVLAQAKSNASQSLVNDIKIIEDTMDYGESTNVELILDKFKSSSNLAERVAYMNILSKRGAPGQEKIRASIDHIDSLYKKGDISEADLNDFKELTTMNGGIMSSGKDIEFWLTNQRDSSGNLRDFKSISDDAGTWSGLSTSAIANMNIVAQFKALDLLQTQRPDVYRQYVEMIKNDPARGGIKRPVREKHNLFTPDELAEINKTNP